MKADSNSLNYFGDAPKFTPRILLRDYSTDRANYSGSRTNIIPSRLDHNKRNSPEKQHIDITISPSRSRVLNGNITNSFMSFQSGSNEHNKLIFNRPSTAPPVTNSDTTNPFVVVDIHNHINSPSKKIFRPFSAKPNHYRTNSDLLTRGKANYSLNHYMNYSTTKAIPISDAYHSLNPFQKSMPLPISSYQTGYKNGGKQYFRAGIESSPEGYNQNDGALLLNNKVDVHFHKPTFDSRYDEVKSGKILASKSFVNISSPTAKRMMSFNNSSSETQFVTILTEIEAKDSSDPFPQRHLIKRSPSHQSNSQVKLLVAAKSSAISPETSTEHNDEEINSLSVSVPNLLPSSSAHQVGCALNLFSMACDMLRGYSRTIAIIGAQNSGTSQLIFGPQNTSSSSCISSGLLVTMAKELLKVANSCSSLTKPLKSTSTPRSGNLSDTPPTTNSLNVCLTATELMVDSNDPMNISPRIILKDQPILSSANAESFAELISESLQQKPKRKIDSSSKKNATVLTFTFNKTGGKHAYGLINLVEIPPYDLLGGISGCPALSKVDAVDFLSSINNSVGRNSSPFKSPALVERFPQALFLILSSIDTYMKQNRYSLLPTAFNSRLVSEARPTSTNKSRLESSSGINIIWCIGADWRSAEFLRGTALMFEKLALHQKHSSAEAGQLDHSFLPKGMPRELVHFLCGRPNTINGSNDTFKLEESNSLNTQTNHKNTLNTLNEAKSSNASLSNFSTNQQMKFSFANDSSSRITEAADEGFENSSKMKIKNTAIPVHSWDELKNRLESVCSRVEAALVVKSPPANPPKSVDEHKESHAVAPLMHHSSSLTDEARNYANLLVNNEDVTDIEIVLPVNPCPPPFVTCIQTDDDPPQFFFQDNNTKTNSHSHGQQLSPTYQFNRNNYKNQAHYENVSSKSNFYAKGTNEIMPSTPIEINSNTQSPILHQLHQQPLQQPNTADLLHAALLSKADVISDLELTEMRLEETSDKLISQTNAKNLAEIKVEALTRDVNYLNEEFRMLLTSRDEIKLRAESIEETKNRDEEHFHNQIKAMKESHNAEISKLQHQLNDFKELLRDMEDKKMNDALKISDLESKFDISVSSVELSKNTITSLNSKIKIIENTNEALKDENYQLQEKFKQDTMKNLEEQKKITESHLQSLDLEKKTAEDMRSVLELEHQKKISEFKNGTLKDKDHLIEKLRREIEVMKNDFIKEKDDIENSYNRMINGIDENRNREFEKLQKETSELKKYCNDFKNSFEIKETSWNQDKEEMRLRALKAESISINLEKTVGDLKCEIARLNAKISSREGELAHFNTMVEAKEGEAGVLVEELHKLRASLLESNQEKIKLQTDVNLMKSKVSLLDSELESTQKMLVSSRGELEAHTHELESQRSTIKSLENYKDRMNKALPDKEHEISTWMEKFSLLKSVNEDNVNEKIQATNEARKLTVKLDEAQAQILKLKNDIFQANSSLNLEREAAKKLISSLETLRSSMSSYERENISFMQGMSADAQQVDFFKSDIERLRKYVHEQMKLLQVESAQIQEQSLGAVERHASIVSSKISEANRVLNVHINSCSERDKYRQSEVVRLESVCEKLFESLQNSIAHVKSAANEKTDLIGIEDQLRDALARVFEVEQFKKRQHVVSDDKQSASPHRHLQEEDNDTKRRLNRLVDLARNLTVPSLVTNKDNGNQNHFNSSLNLDISLLKDKHPNHVISVYPSPQLQKNLSPSTLNIYTSSKAGNNVCEITQKISSPSKNRIDDDISSSPAPSTKFLNSIDSHQSLASSKGLFTPVECELFSVPQIRNHSISASSKSKINFIEACDSETDVALSLAAGKVLSRLERCEAILHQNCKTEDEPQLSSKSSKTLEISCVTNNQRSTLGGSLNGLGQYSLKNSPISVVQNNKVDLLKRLREESGVDEIKKIFS